MSSEQAVLLYLRLETEFGTGSEREAIFALEETLRNAVEGPAVGEVDGDEFGEGFCRIYFYGRSADLLLDSIFPALINFPIRPNSFAIKRYGEPGAREQIVHLESVGHA